MDMKILFFIVINFYCIQANPYDINHLLKRGEKFCGDRLSQMMRFVCNGNYNGPNKRIYNDIFNYGEYEDSEENVPESNIVFPFLQKESVKSLISQKSRKSVGIVYECCYKSCTREHLQLYCKN